MESIKRNDINEQWAHSGIVEAGDFAFISYCVGNIGSPARKSIQTEFAHVSGQEGLLFQLDAITYKK